MIGELSPWHLLILAGIVVLLFGSKRLPGAARSLGQSMRILRSEANALHAPEATGAETVGTAASLGAAQPQPVLAQPQPVLAQPQPVLAQPQPVLAQPQQSSAVG